MNTIALHAKALELMNMVETESIHRAYELDTTHMTRRWDDGGTETFPFDVIGSRAEIQADLLLLGESENIPKDFDPKSFYCSAMLQLSCCCARCYFFAWSLRKAVQAEYCLWASLLPLGLDLTQRCRDRFIFRLAELYFNGKAEKVMKLTYCYWSAMALEQDLSGVVPEGAHFLQLYDGVAWSRLRRIIAVKSRGQRRQLAQCLLVAKKGTPVVDISFVGDATQKAMQRLTSKPATFEPHWFEREIERTVAEVFPNDSFSVSASAFLPSMRGCLPIDEHPVLGLNYSQRSTHYGGWKLRRSKRCAKWKKCGSLVRDGLRGKSFVRPDGASTEKEMYELLDRSPSSVWKGDVAGSRRAMGTLGLFQELFTPIEVAIYGHGDFVTMYERAGSVYEWRDCRELISDRLTQFCVRRFGLEVRFPFCQPVPICEPFKVRVITKGPPALQFILGYAQKFMWRMLKRHPCFALTGRPATTADIVRVFDSLPLASSLISGDYEAATDYLASWASSKCWSAICARSGIPVQLEIAGDRILTQHLIVGQPTEKGVLTWDWKSQLNGQLMGSRISFPILCLINAATTRYAMELAYGRSFTLADTCMLVNGDDILFHLPDTKYKLWQDLTRAVGLRMSAGKNYQSKHFAVINSRMYERVPPLEVFHEEDVVRMVPFVNAGLLLGVGRAVCDGGDDLDSPGLASRAHTLVECAPPALRDQLIGEFLQMNRAELEEAAHPQQSFWVPRYAGGLGLPKPSWITFEHVSPLARRVCRYLCGEKSSEMWIRDRAAAMPKFVQHGLRQVAELEDKLRLPRQVVPLQDTRWFEKDDYIHSFFGFALRPGWARQEHDPKGHFEKLIGRSKHVPMGLDFPSFDRVEWVTSLDTTARTDLGPRVLAETATLALQH